MSYALILAADKRVLSATFSEYASDGSVIVDSLPDGDISQYRYIDGTFVLEPLVENDSTKESTLMDRLEAQVTYTAMMTDTLLEV